MRPQIKCKQVELRLQKRSCKARALHAPIPRHLSDRLCTGREETSDEVAVLHYTYNKFDDLKSRRDRCDCAPTEDDAKRCFILPFDRMVRHFLLLGIL